MDYQLIKTENYVVGYCRISGERSYRTEHETANRLLDALLSDIFRVEPGTLSIKKRPGGKPFFEDSDIFFNISHCHDLAACAVSRRCEVGVDVEAVKEYRESTAKRVMSEAEYKYFQSAGEKNKKFFQIWTYKESVLKLTGEGIRRDLREVDSCSGKAYKVDCFEFILDDKEYILSCAVKN